MARNLLAGFRLRDWHAARNHRNFRGPMERLPNIVLVDDDELDVMNVQRAFEKAKIDAHLFVAANGYEALDLLRSGQVPRRKIILLDLNMPRMNGIEFLEKLRADPELKSIPVVVLTTSADERDREAAYQHCISGYMIKPTSFQASIDFVGALARYWSHVELP